MLKIIAFGAALLTASVAFAAPITGKTSSHTISTNAEVCDPQAYTNAINNTIVWYLNGAVADLYASENPEEVKMFVQKWNSQREQLITEDATSFVYFKALPDQGFNPEDVGEWVFFFKDGCYLGNVFVPTAEPVKVVNGVALTPDGNSSSHRPGAFLKDIFNGS